MLRVFALNFWHRIGFLRGDHFATEMDDTTWGPAVEQFWLRANSLYPVSPSTRI